MTNHPLRHLNDCAMAAGTRLIWWTDLRGSTSLAERLPRQQYLQLLNQFFECTAGVVIERGGEVLKFIGDAVLAIFPLREFPDAGERALDAAIEALAQVRKLNAESTPAQDDVEIALALHRGEVNYGNVGVARGVCGEHESFGRHSE